jgi:SAM-dependent methyltransferase
MRSTYLFGGEAGDQQRLRDQYELLREDFLAWFERALQKAGLTDSPEHATFSVLEVGCGQGWHARDLAARYPHATIVATDLQPVPDPSGPPNLRFAVHDAREPVPAELVPPGGFDLAVGWMVLLHLPDKPAALAHLAAAVRPGGALLLGNVPDEAVLLDHPAARPILAAGHIAAQRVGIAGYADRLEPWLDGAGFTDVRTALLRYLAGGATVAGQRWYRPCLAAFVVGRPLLVDVTRLMDGAEYDRLLDQVLAAPVLDVSGEMRYLVTVARRADTAVPSPSPSP